MDEKRVVVTGIGAVTPLGNDAATFWENATHGVCGITRISKFPTDDLPSHVAGELKDFRPEEHGVEKPFVRKQDWFAIYAMAAAHEAVLRSGLVSGENIDPMRFGTYIGSGIGGYILQFNEISKMVKEGPKWISPTYISSMISNMASGLVAIRFGARGACVPISTACATGTTAIGEAYRAIKYGYADAIIAGGTEAVTIPMTVAAFGNSRALTRAEDPAYASLPFNANRGGFVLGEGSGILILEEYEHAKKRGAEILAEICGYGNTCDAYNQTAPRPEGTTQAAAIRMAAVEAGLDPVKDCVYINAHGTGTALNDTCETKAFKLAFGDDAYKFHISSTKSMTGHLLGAAGGVEAIAAIMALRDGVVPPTINLDTPDPECDLDYTPNVAVKAPLTITLSDSLGFGGHNACIAFRKI